MAEATPIPRGEVGYASPSLIYSGRDFIKYSPDVLYSYKGVGVYDKMMHDDQVKAAVEFKTGAVVSRAWYFDVAKDPVTGDEIEDYRKIADFYYAVIEQIRGSWTDKLIELLSALKYGFTVAEKVFEPIAYKGRSYWGIGDIKVLPTSTMLGAFQVDQHGNVLAIRQQAVGRTIEIPPEKVIHFVHRPEIDRHYGESDLRAAYRSWWSKDIVIKYQNIYLERSAGGFIWAQVDPSKGNLTSTDKANLEKVLSNISAMTGIYVPASVTLNAIQPLRTDAYEAAIAQHDKAIAKALLVPNLLGISEQGDVGSYSQSETQMQAFFWVLDLIARRLEDCLNEQLFKQLARINFGTDQYPRFRFEPISEQTKQRIAAIWSDLVSKGAVTKSDSDESFLRQLVGFPAKARDEEGKESEMPPENDEEDEPQDSDDAIAERLEAIPEEKREKAKKEFDARPWLKRIDFAEIKAIMASHDTELAKKLAGICAKIRLSLEDQITRIGGERSWGNVRPAELMDVAVPKTLLTMLRKQLRASLTDALDAAYDAARKELPKRQFARVRPGMDKTQAERFLASKAMKITGVIERVVLEAVQQELENSIKYDRSLKDTINGLEKNTALLSVLPRVDSAGRAINVPARLENIARTNISDAVNQARMALFQDPALKGFVQAYEYSAILDDRTTEICEMLHGLVRKEWGEFVPPNHFQCRSILVPVTEVDGWNGKEDPFPAEAAGAKTFPNQMLPPLSDIAPLAPEPSVRPPEQVPQEPTQAKSTAAAEAFARKYLLKDAPQEGLQVRTPFGTVNIGSVDLTGISVEMANALNSELARVLKGAKIDAIVKDNTDKTIFAVLKAVINKERRTIFIYNPKYVNSLKDFNGIVERIAQTGHMKKASTISDFINHEFGHMIDLGEGDKFRSRVSDSLDAVLAKHGEVEKLKKKIGDLCGKYSKTNSAEMFAELYRVWKGGMLPDDLGFIGDWLRKAEERFYDRYSVPKV